MQLLWQKLQFWGWLSRSQHVNDGVFVASLMSESGLSEAKILKLARRKLRRIPWRNISLDLLTKTLGTDASTYELSESCSIGDIDFFISHSWSDDPYSKYEQLQSLAAWFKEVRE